MNPINDQSSSVKQPTSTPRIPSAVSKTSTSSDTKTVELPKIQSQHVEIHTRKQRIPSAQSSRSRGSTSTQPQLQHSLLSRVSSPSSVPSEPIKVLPLTIFDFNGSPEYYEHISPFIDTNALHIICIHAVAFHQAVPGFVGDIFNGTINISSSSVITQLFQLLQILCDKATKTRAIIILPVATCIDLYEKQSKQEQ